MNNFSWHRELAGIVKIAFIFITGVCLIPFIIGFYNNITPAAIFGFIVSILIFQPFAVVIGLGLGISPVPVLLIMCSTGLSVIFVLFGTCDMFSNRSEWLQRHLEKIEGVTQNSHLFGKYGIFSFIPLIWVPGVGLYGCVLIAWLFKWRGSRAVTILFSAWILATLVVLLSSIGILAVIL